MKVVKIIGTLDFGGIEKVFETVALSFEGNPKDITFIALNSGGKTSENIKRLGYKVIILNESIKIPNLRLILKLYREIQNLKPDVVHTCGAEANFHGTLAAKLLGIKIIIAEEIGIPSHSKLAKVIFRLIYKQCNAIIAVSKNVKNYIVSNNEAEDDKVHVIYNPVDLVKFNQIESSEDNKSEYIITSVCRLHPIKNLMFLIRCIYNLSFKYPNLKLWIIGDGPQRKELENLIVKLGLQTKVILWGYKEDPEEFLRKTNLFILPSHSEGHPISMIESMTSGVPVLVTKVGGASEIITDGENGWLLDPNDEEGLKRKIEMIMSLSTIEIKSIVKSARELVVDKFSPFKYHDKLNHLYSTSS